MRLHECGDKACTQRGGQLNLDRRQGGFQQDPLLLSPHEREPGEHEPCVGSCPHNYQLAASRRCGASERPRVGMDGVTNKASAPERLQAEVQGRQGAWAVNFKDMRGHVIIGAPPAPANRSSTSNMPPPTRPRSTRAQGDTTAARESLDP